MTILLENEIDLLGREKERGAYRFMRANGKLSCVPVHACQITETQANLTSFKIELEGLLIGDQNLSQIRCT